MRPRPAARAPQELVRLKGLQEKLEKSMAVPAYASRVPAFKQEEDKAKLEDLQAQAAQVQRALAQFE